MDESWGKPLNPETFPFLLVHWKNRKEKKIKNDFKTSGII